MLQRFLYFKLVLDRLFAFAPQIHKKLVPFLTTKKEWDMTNRISEILYIFVQSTKQLCAEKFSTLYLQLPYFHFLLKDLSTIVQTEIIAATIVILGTLAFACDEAWQILNTYWNKTEEQTTTA